MCIHIGVHVDMQVQMKTAERIRTRFALSSRRLIELFFSCGAQCYFSSSVILLQSPYSPQKTDFSPIFVPFLQFFSCSIGFRLG